MCIFNLPVKTVKNTKIFVAPIKGNWQFTAYTNEVVLSSGAENAMILPFPNGGIPDCIRMVDLSKASELFTKCEEAFPRAQLMSFGNLNDRSWSSSNYLEVLTVGSYSVSIAQNLNDLRRIDPSVFKLMPNIDLVLSQNYATGYGFVVCKFNKSQKAHPIGYCHPIVSGTLFVPTRHEHGDTTKSIFSPPHWDHEIYSFDTLGEDAGSSTQELYHELKLQHGGNPNWTVTIGDPTRPYHYLKNLVAVCMPTCVRRKTIKGYHTNQDFFYSLLPGILTSNRPSVTPSTQSSVPTNNAVHSLVTCDNCTAKPLRGFRLKCIDCVDYDLCWSCYHSRKQYHPTHHLFAIIENEDDAKNHILVQNRSPLVHNFQCTGCMKGPIVGIRYFCPRCKVNLCEDCENTGLKHTREHSVQKIYREEVL
eukprot:TRINITY_DN2390_c0_g2_i1.p1 TRINITY_DN2390_c0_g2~~TRINITY_DN2390_c0_g2_i1.p1  ORF type:complete len:419 (-),score=18.24 TRINITY_DN2390_c0_g2_i1:26-1282(-)